MPELDFSVVFAGDYRNMLISGAGLTLSLFGIALPLAFLLAVALVAAAGFGGRALRIAADGFVAYHRNTPLLVQLFVWNFGLSQVLPRALNRAINAGHPELVFSIVTLVCYAAAYMSQDLLSGLRSVPAGQAEAAAALGLRRWQAIGLVVLPQAWRFALPPLIGQCVGLLKATSITAVIGVGEMTNQARQIESETFRVIEVFAVITAGYLLATLPLMLVGTTLERRLAASTGREATR